MQIGKDKVVSIEYTLTDPQGQVMDSSQGREPLAYLHGAGNIIPGLEEALEGKSAGDSLTVTVPPDRGYGLRDENLVQEVSRANFRGITDIRPGMQFQAHTPEGTREVTVVGVTEQTVRVDANHALAGVTLTFAVKVAGVREATAEELSHGRVHGPGGHPH